MSALTKTGRGRLSAMLVALVAAFVLLGGGNAFAATTNCGPPYSLPGSCFAAGDGDQLDGPGDLVDWASTGAAAMPDPAKGVDTKFSGGSKELNPGGWDFILGNNTPKTDLLEGWSNLEGGRFLHAAFVRAKQTGDTYLAFELNQAPAGPNMSTAGIPIPNRTTNDVLITYDIGTTGEPALIGMCTWQATGAGTGNWLRLDNVAVGGKVKRCSHLDATTTPAAQGTVNWGHSIANSLPDSLPDFANSIGAGQFGEAAVDLGSVAANFLTNPCGPNGWIWMHSRSSDSVTSQPKDLIGGGPITSPTCDLTIGKKVARGGDPFVDAGTSNPLAAEVGDTLRYQITVTNPGTADLSVNITDALCDPGTLSGPGGRDGVADPLAGGETVTYTCTHVVTQADYDADPTNHLLVNTACTTGTATLGSASTTVGPKCDDAVAQLSVAGTLPPITPIPPDQLVSPDVVAPGNQLVLGARITPGRARLLGPTGCQARAFRARITGTKIAKVVFYLDGKKVKTLTKANFRKTFALRINPAHLRVGVHRLKVKVSFQRGSGTKAKTFRLSFQRCPRALRAPRFTG